MFRKILVANRGEIALRIIRTCARLGVGTVAVYSDADRDAPHVLAADEAVGIGPPDPAASYLCVPRLLAAAGETGAEAIHPGYGFLSERPDFADACARAGLVFIGPPGTVMRRLGDKIEARRLARREGVPVVPGYEGDDQTDARLAAEAERLGLPLLIKAAAGGGGRGMRRVERLDDLSAALSAARREAEQAVGDGRVLLERFVSPARHVEVQVFGDTHGQVLAVGDRECSAQRRHQKLLEEAPAPCLPDAVRAALHAAAARLARAAAYVNAGTLEFLVCGDEFYFLEANTRLQVEHTVTEMVTGLDLVEWQVRIAAGERLAPAAPVTRGHAFEARIYAEDPARGFLPAAGVIRQLRWPAGEGVRVDASVTAPGQRVPPEYDPLLGKVVCWGRDRDEARARLDAALADTVILGLTSNVAYLRRVIATEAFARGAISTEFLGQHPELAQAVPPPPEVLAAVAAACLGGPPPWRALAGWRLGGERRPITLRWEDTPFTAHAAGGGASAPVALEQAIGPEGQRGWEAAFAGGRWVLWEDVPIPPLVDPGTETSAPDAGAPRAENARPSAPGSWFVTAPLAGKLAQLLVQEGEEVTPNAALAWLEAMKMQHALLATRPARVVRVLAASGAFVRAGQPVLELAPLDQSPSPGHGDGAGGELPLPNRVGDSDDVPRQER